MVVIHIIMALLYLDFEHVLQVYAKIDSFAGRQQLFTIQKNQARYWLKPELKLWTALYHNEQKTKVVQ